MVNGLCSTNLGSSVWSGIFLPNVFTILFSLFQFGVGEQIGVDPSWIVASQAVGGAAGNTICVHNVVAASAVAGIYGREGQIIRKTLPLFLYYAIGAGIICWLIVTFG